MAPSSNCMLTALLVALAAVVAPSLHQSAAARAMDGGAASAAATPAPSANDDGEAAVVHPTAMYDIPDLPLPRILPCPPVLPKIPFIPCHNVTPPPPPAPKECRSPLMKQLMPPCTGFLTNSSVGEAPAECCHGVDWFLNSDDYRFCFCHVMNDGDANQLVPAPLTVNHTRALSIFQACGYGLKPNTVLEICNDEEMRHQVPPMDLPKPPTPAPGRNKA